MADDLEPDDMDGEYVELDEDESDVEDTDDGGAIVKLDESPKEGDSEFLSNLAETLPSQVLNTLASDFIDLITRDKEARSKRDKQYEEDALDQYSLSKHRTVTVPLLRTMLADRDFLQST